MAGRMVPARWRDGNHRTMGRSGPGRLRRRRQPALRHAEVGLAHRLDEALIGPIGDADQAEVAVLAIQQAPARRLVEVLEPVGADDQRLLQRLFEEMRVGRSALLLPRDFGETAPERAAVAVTQVALSY